MPGTVLKVLRVRGAWGPQLVKLPTLDFIPGHAVTVREFKPHIGPCADSADPELSCVHALSLPLPHNINRLKKQ